MGHSMAVKEILRMGHPILQKVALPVTEFGTRELDTIIVDMLDTMEAQSGAGLAAPQIGISKRVVIFGIEHNPRYPDADPIPTTVIINPEITIIGDTIDRYWEGCLSIPGMRGLVPRSTLIKYTGFDQKGCKIETNASDFHARVVQHEVDHLDGILYPERIENMKNFVFEDQLSE